MGKKNHFRTKQYYSNPLLHGCRSLSVIQVTECIDESGAIIKSDSKTLIYHLSKVTEEELFQHRLSKKPGFVFKKEGNLFYTSIPKDLSLISCRSLGAHVCAHSGSACRHLYAKKECDGGCSKVRDNSLLCHRRNGYTTAKALKLSSRIEKYNFITLGFESFNTLQTAFVVLNCSNYANSPTRHKKTVMQINNAKLAIAQYVYPEINCLEDL